MILIDNLLSSNNEASAIDCHLDNEKYQPSPTIASWTINVRIKFIQNSDNANRQEIAAISDRKCNLKYFLRRLA